MKITSILLCLSLLLVSAQPVLALETSYRVQTLVTENDDTHEENSSIIFGDNSFKLVSKKSGAVLKEINYTDVKTAEYSFSKKPMWKTAAIAAVFIHVFALPIFLMKSKSHWLTIRSEKDFAVLKLEKDNFRLVRSEFETHNVTVANAEQENKKKDKSSKQGT